MQALFVSSPAGVRLRAVKKPIPKSGEILIKMRCCGVCGTDLEKMNGKAVTSPVLGHEAVGEIAELGKGVLGFSEGDRVFTHHHAACYTCLTCVRGEYTLCDEYSRYNLVPGGFSEYYIVPSWNVSKGAVFRLSPELDFETGSFIEPLACCIRALEKVSAGRFHSAVVYGAGPVGLLHLKLLRLYGCGAVAVADPSLYRSAFAEKLGADFVFDPLQKGTKRTGRATNRRPELAIVSTASMAALQDALTAVTKGGTVLLFGAPYRNTVIDLDVSKLFFGSTSIVPSYAASERETALAADMLADGSLEVSDLVTHRFPLSDAPQAFATADNQKCIKAVVKN
jgi:L-iditol 2-dehydrogenase